MMQVATHGQVVSVYLSRVPLGVDCLSVTAAAKAFFGSSRTALMVQQTAWLPALQAAPDRILQAPETWQKRANMVVELMLEDGVITPAKAAKATILDVSQAPTPVPCGN